MTSTVATQAMVAVPARLAQEACLQDLAIMILRAVVVPKVRGIVAAKLQTQAHPPQVIPVGLERTKVGRRQTRF